MLSNASQKWAAVAACLSMLISPNAMAVPQHVAAAAPVDVALQNGDVLVGQVVDAQGGALAGAEVTIRSAGQELFRVRSDQQGVYRVAGLRAGVYEVATAGSVGVYRLWAPRTSPPAASRALLLVANSDVVRGQYPGPAPGPGPFATAMGWIAEHPILTTLGAAAAITIPLAINDYDPAS